jgi:hypothetical protein
MERPPAGDGARCARLLWLWLVVRTALWLGAAVCTQPNAPLDLIEWLAWGHQFAWGYPKHPPLPGWVAELFARLSPGDVWGVYLAGYLHAAACLWAAWRLGREYLPPRQALLSALCLDGLIYLTGDAAEFSNNLSLDVAWALTVLFFVRAVRTGRLRSWLALGAAIGLGMLCKYTLGVLLVPLAGYLVWDRGARGHLRRPGPYLAALLAAVLFAPHAVWLAHHDFLTVRYAADRSVPAGWAGHLTHPAAFLLTQLLKLLPVVVVLLPLLRRRDAEWGGVPRSDLAVLHWAVLGPVVLLLVLSLTTGCQLRDVWGSPLWTFAGVWLLALAGPAKRKPPRHSAFRIPHSAFVPWAAVAAGVLAFWVVKNEAGPYVEGHPSRVHYSGRRLAREVARRWSARCAEPFRIVAGEAWRAGNVCCYAPQRPMLYSSGGVGYFVFDPEHVPWTDDADLRARGGVLLWDAGQFGDALPEIARLRFPAAEAQPPIILPYQTGAAAQPDRVGVAFVWPAP